MSEQEDSKRNYSAMSQLGRLFATMGIEETNKEILKIKQGISKSSYSIMFQLGRLFEIIEEKKKRGKKEDKLILDLEQRAKSLKAAILDFAEFWDKIKK